MSEAELHVLRARLDGGIRNKAQRGELRRGLPVGLVWGEDEGQILLHPDEAVTGVIAAVFARFAACGSVRGTWLWLREQHLKWPLQPAAYVRGSAGDLGGADLPRGAHHAHPSGLRRRVRVRPHPPGTLRRPGRDLRTRRRVRPRRVGGADPRSPPGIPGLGRLPGQPAPDPAEHPPGGPPARHRRRPGGLRPAAGPGHLRHLRPQARRLLRRRHHNTPGYYCTGTGHLIDGRGTRHLRVGGVAIDDAVGQAFLAAMAGTR